MHNRNLTILFVCQLIAAGGSIMIVTLGGIMGASLAPSPALATLPISLMIVGTALTTVPASMLMKRIGRRRGFSFAALCASIAVALAAYALAEASFTLFCIATLLFGCNLAFVQQYRFAAAESVPAERVGRAISLVLLGAIGGALFGPLLITYGRDWFAAGPYVGSMLGLAALFLLASVILTGLHTPPESVARDDELTPRPLREIVAQPVYLVAVLGGVVGYGVMTFIMTATPISMHLHDGFTIEKTSSVIRAHVIAMYAPSLLSGYLIERVGVMRMMTLGAILMAVTVGAGLAGHALVHYWVALVALGIGWNFLYVGGTTLLTRTYRQSERFKSQAVNDFSVFTASALGSLLSGTIIQLYGWTTMILTAIGPLLVVMFALVALRGRPHGAGQT